MVAVADHPQWSAYWDKKHQKRAPHKPLLLPWLFGQFAGTGSSVASYQQAEAPVNQLINDFGPPVASPAAARQQAAMPFVHWNASSGTCGTPPTRRSARTHPNAAPGYWTAEPQAACEHP